MDDGLNLPVGEGWGSMIAKVAFPAAWLSEDAESEMD